MLLVDDVEAIEGQLSRLIALLLSIMFHTTEFNFQRTGIDIPIGLAEPAEGEAEPAQQNICNICMLSLRREGAPPGGQQQRGKRLTPLHLLPEHCRQNVARRSSARQASPLVVRRQSAMGSSHQGILN